MGHGEQPELQSISSEVLDELVSVTYSMFVSHRLKSWSLKQLLCEVELDRGML